MLANSMPIVLKNNISSVDDDISAMLNIDELRWLAAIDLPPREATLTTTPVAPAAPGALPTRVAAKTNSSQTKPTLAKSSPSPAQYTPSPDLAKYTHELELALDPETCSLYVESQSLYAEAESSSSTSYTRIPAPGHITSSPPSSFKRPTPSSKLELSNHTHPMRVQSPAPHRNRHYRLGEPSSIPIRLPFSPSPPPPILPFGSSSKASSIVIPSPASTSSHSSHLSRSLPTSSARRPEWIYRHPKPRKPSTPFPLVPSLATSSSLSPSPPSSPSRTRTRSTASRHKPRPQTGYLSRSVQSKPLPPSPKHAGSGSASNPFWSSILRQRPRSRRSIPALNFTAASQAPSNVASTVPPPVPPKSPSRPPFHVRTASTSSTASSGSVYSTNTTSTTTTSSPAIPPAASTETHVSHVETANSTRTRLHSASSSSSSGSTGTASSDTTATSSSPPHTPSSTPFPSHSPAPLPLSSSCPLPAKSILTRSLSVSTTGNHSLASGTGTHSASLLSCASKSVTFVDVPTVHYHNAGSWGIGRVEEEEGAYGDEGEDLGICGVRGRGADLGSDMGVDLDGMDLDLDMDSDAFGARSKDSTKGLKRLMSLSRKAPPATRPSRPTISGPFALGAFNDAPRRSSSPARSTHSFRSASTCSPSLRSAPPSLRPTPSVRSTHSLGHTYKPTHLKAHSYSHPATKPRVGYPASVHSLRAEPSCESLGRSVRSLGSVKSTASTRGFRAWLTKIGAGIGLAGVGWEP